MTTESTYKAIQTLSLAMNASNASQYLNSVRNSDVKLVTKLFGMYSLFYTNIYMIHALFV